MESRKLVLRRGWFLWCIVSTCEAVVILDKCSRARFLLTEKVQTHSLIGARTGQLWGCLLDRTTAAHRGVARYDTGNSVGVV